jgi:RHH-type proline utilization regulon transcriptional repressor/proline dehydrogenase/delta 1-pyrroline-5-carboxylate dehydrogenase
MADDGAVERELFEVGRKLAAALPTTRNPLKALDDKAMDLASSDAELKAALFRFVDVVPACRNLDDLARHLTGFLGEVGEPPPPISAAMKMGNSRAGHFADSRATVSSASEQRAA